MIWTVQYHFRLIEGQGIRTLKIVVFAVKLHIFELISLFHSFERFQQTFDPFWAPLLFFSVATYLWVFGQDQRTFFNIYCSNATQTFSLNLSDFINARHCFNRCKILLIWVSIVFFSVAIKSQTTQTTQRLTTLLRPQCLLFISQLSMLSFKYQEIIFC